MYLESLLRLAQIVEEFNAKGEKIISEEFHKETEELLILQSKFLSNEIEFLVSDPGPYDFGFGDLTITVYSPQQTEVQEWAAIARKGTWQKNYRFNSILGLVKVFSLAINDSVESEK